eukprot:8005742-Pyramimonas_sp.AAC.2
MHKHEHSGILAAFLGSALESLGSASLAVSGADPRNPRRPPTVYDHAVVSSSTLANPGGYTQSQ